MHKNVEIVHHDGQELQQGVASTRRETEEIRALLEGSVKDSKTLKTLTFIALIYLPANLIAVSLDHSLRLQKEAYCAEQNSICYYEWDEIFNAKQSTSFIQGIFNSNLLSFNELNHNSSSQHLTISKGVWLYFVLSALLTMLTVGATLRWENFSFSAIRRWVLRRTHP